jgi:hypothetical protein
MKIKLEYLWLDGYMPEPNLRSKVKIVNYDDIKNSLIEQKSFRCEEERFISR